MLLKIGECFLEVAEDGVKEFHKKLLDQAKSDMDKLQEDKGEVEKIMKDLKAHLYAKFGTNINLGE